MLFMNDVIHRDLKCLFIGIQCRSFMKANKDLQTHCHELRKLGNEFGTDTSTAQGYLNTVNPLLSPLGGYVFQARLREGLIQRGGLFERGGGLLLIYLPPVHQQLSR